MQEVTMLSVDSLKGYSMYIEKGQIYMIILVFLKFILYSLFTFSH